MNAKVNLKSIVLFLGLVVLIACSKEEPFNPNLDDINIPIEEIPGIDIGEVETDNGSIGLSIDTRKIARKGYKPSTADIMVDASSGDFSKSGVSIDEYTNMVVLNLDMDNLTQTQKDELQEGVPVTITIKDENNQVIETKTITKKSFTPSPGDIFVEGADLEDKNAEVSIRSDVPHYLQILKEDESAVWGGIPNISWEHTDRSNSFVDGMGAQYLDYQDDTKTLFYFNPIAGKPGVFSISHRNNSDIFYLYMGTDRLHIQNKRNLGINGSNTDVSNRTNYQFKIEKVDLGKYTITPLSHTLPFHMDGEVRIRSREAGFKMLFRIVSFEIDWDVQSIDTRYEQPILPPSNTGSAFNSTLKNCSSGELVQTVGQSKTEESIKTRYWEESMSVSTRHTFGVSVTAGVEVETKFFGNGGKASGSITGSYEYSKETTNASKNGETTTTSESITVSTERMITVPPKKATQVTDLFQTYNNVRIPFAQRFRIRGSEGGNDLTGQEIMTQFHFNGFSGVVTEIAADYIEVTVKGVTEIDKLIDTKTSAEDVPTNCG